MEQEEMLIKFSIKGKILSQILSNHIPRKGDGIVIPGHRNFEVRDIIIDYFKKEVFVILREVVS